MERGAQHLVSDSRHRVLSPLRHVKLITPVVTSIQHRETGAGLLPIIASKVLDLYRQRTPTSEKLAAQARELFPSGITHDSRYLAPYPIYVERAEGSRKWDVDGNEYVDYSGGHGALLLGHNHPAVTEAVTQQLARGTHYGASHELEMHWAEIVLQLLPSSQRTRFTNSGTEATLLAFRLSRAFSGKSKILRFLSNFHGWQDHVAFGVRSHFDGTPTPGVLAEVADNVVLCPPGDIEAVSRLLAKHNDIAAIILEPTGGTWGQTAVTERFVHELREVTDQHGVLLIFDEVISGFRCSPGGAQGHLGIRPDLTTLAKILAGGFPGGAVAGRRDILDLLDHEATARQGIEKIGHQGTYNANPISAAAGIAALQIVASSDVCQRANDYAARLRENLRQVVRDQQLDWCIYGAFSGFHIFTNPDREPISADDLEQGRVDFRKIAAAAKSELNVKIRLGMLACGVEIFAWPGGVVSAVHNDDDLERTVNAFKQTIQLIDTDT